MSATRKLQEFSWSIGCCAAVAAGLAAAATREPNEIATRVQLAAATLADAVLVDCQLPGRLLQLGGMRTYMTPGVLTRLTAIDCRTRGGEYTIGDLASGTLSLHRWLPLAEKDNVEAQYYVARIYANGMDGVPVDYVKAAQWYQRAVQKKYLPAMQELGYLYEQGLGVPQDALQGLNLQRQASGLGDELDYSSRIAANKEEFTRQITALTDQLDTANASVEELRSQLDDANDRLLQSDTQADRDQARLRELRGQLEAARRGGSGQNSARIKQLQEQLAASEAELARRQESIGTLATDLTVQQAQLSTELARSQSANAQLNELLASNRSENESLRTRLAQSEQRLVQSQQELASLRADYLRETSALAARSVELQQLRAHGNDAAVALLDGKQRDLDRQQQQIRQLESQLAAARQQASAGHAAGADAAAHNRDLEQALAALRIQNSQQQQELQAQRAAFAHLQSQSKDDQAALLNSLDAQLTQKAAELEDKQRRIASLQQAANQLRDTYDRDRDGSQRALAAANAEAQQGHEALRTAQDTIAKQHDALEQLQMQSAAVQLQLVQARTTLTQQASSSDRAAQQRIAVLETDLQAKDRQIEQLHAQLASAEQQLKDGKPQLVATAEVSYRMPQPAGSGNGNPSAMIQMVRSLGPANYHALIIANGNYRYMEKLKTPLNDAQDIRKLLEGRYGFEVKMLIDATRDQIMSAMNEYARTLTDSDRLLIYFAGHGSTRDFPPERAFWAAIDTDPNVMSSWLSAQTISDAIWAIRARHILLVADSCFSSVITHATSTIVARSNDEHSVRIQWSRSARMVLTSGQDQPVVDSSSSDSTHSLFADLFIAVLRQNNLLMSGEMLAHEISSRMTDYSARLGLKQTPTYSNLQDPQHMFGDFFFAPVASAIQVAAVTP